MKKIFIPMLIGATCMIFSSVNALAAPLLSLVVNGDTVQSNVSPVLVDNRTLVPARAVFEKLGASVDWSAEQQKVYVALSNYKVELKLEDTTAYVNGNPVTMDVPAKLINDSTMIPARFVAEQLNMNVSWNQNDSTVIINNSQLGSISAAPSSSGNVDVTINVDYFQNYRTFKLSNPSRIVIDFPNVSAPGSLQKIDVNSGSLSSIRYCKFADASGYSAARVVLDVDDSTDFKAEKQDNKLVVHLTGGNTLTPAPQPSATPSPNPSPSPTATPTPGQSATPAPSVNPSPSPSTGSNYKNITYKMSGDRIFFQLNNGDLAYLPSQEQKKYYDFYENDGKRYIMRYQKELADLGEGTMNINDSLFESVQFVKDDGTGYSRIIFNCKTKLNFITFERVNYDNNNSYIDTVIDVIVPPSPNDKIVVIDPGHGGLETGAYSNGLTEKALNLDISLRVNNLLKAKGIKTYITRADDSYVDLYERAIIANNLNAKMFVCIHNNSFNGSAYGTETLYYSPGSGASKSVAAILQAKMVNALGSYDRGIVSRPNLVVLNRTKMPAALVEVGFIDNPTERANLMSEDYKNRAAQAICDGIIESLSKL